jgi:hypothetical protein
LPFSREAILEHLQSGRTDLIAALNARKLKGTDELSEALERAVELLAELTDDFSSSLSPEAKKLEQSLSGLEGMLSKAVRSVVEAEQLASLEREVKEQLRPYRKQMEASVYQQTLDHLLMKRLREQFGIPRLSLFYL